MVRAARALLVASLVACSSEPEPEPTPTVAPSPAPVAEETPTPPPAKEDLFGAIKPTTVAEAVDLVRAIRTEPYAGVLRGAAGTWAAKAGGPADKAVLLAELLRRQGRSVRYAHAKLNDAQIDAVLEGFELPAPPAWATATDDPRKRPELRAAVAEHVWVEYREGEKWIPADGTFPGLAPGAAVATTEPPWAEIPRDRVHTVTLAWVERKDGRDEVLLKLEKPASELAAVPVRLVAKLVPYKRPLKPGEKIYVPPPPPKPVRGQPPPPVPSVPPPPPPKLAAPTEVRVQRTLVVGDASSPALVKARAADAPAEAERVDVVLKGPGYEEKFSRPLIAAGVTPAQLREHDVLVVLSEVSRDNVRDELRPTGGFSPQIWLDKLTGGGPVERDQLAHAVVPRAGRALLIAAVAEDDAAAARAASAARAILLYDRPRLAFTDRSTRWDGVDATSVTTSVAVDLRYNDVNVLPGVGGTPGLARLVERTRGVVDAAAVDALGRYLFAGGDSALGAWGTSRTAGGPSKVYATGAVDLLDGEAERMNAALAAGRRVWTGDAVGDPPVRAWWEIDPTDGDWKLWREGGIEFTRTEPSLAVADAWDDEVGYLRGLTTGEALLAAKWSMKLADYAAVTAAVEPEVVAGVAGLACTACEPTPVADCSVEPPTAPTACGGEAVALACAVGLATTEPATWTPTTAPPACPSR